LNTDMRKFESSQKDESRAQSADSSKAYGKPSRAFKCQFLVLHFMREHIGQNLAETSLSLWL